MDPFRYVLLTLAVLCVGGLVRSVNPYEKTPERRRRPQPEDRPADPSHQSQVFKPTSDWRPLPRDQAIPRGVHVRLNLQTGKREAKLLDPNEEEAESDKHELDYKRDDNSRGTSPPDGISPEELKHILHKMEGNERVRSDDDIGRVKHKFRSYEELKKELHNLRATVKTDLEIMSELMENYKSLVKRRTKLTNVEVAGTDEEEMNILTDLEFLVHQIDNAKEFVKNGLTDVVFPSLNSTSSKVRYEATKLLGSAVQNNPSAQISALELGTVSILLRSLSIDPSPQVKTGALYALSCLVRRFPAAQARLVERGGLTVFAKLFQSDTSDLLKLQIKVVTFVNDLILEKRDAERAVLTGGNMSEDFEKEAKERLRQYNTIGIERKLKDEGWCKLLTKLLVLQELREESGKSEEDIRTAEEGTSVIGLRPEHDNIEKLSSAMLSMADVCHREFEQDRKLSDILIKLTLWYRQLSAKEHDEFGYFTVLSEQIGNLTNKIHTPIAREEL